MDYIKTLLLRQQSLLRALMLGSGTVEEKQRRPGPDGELAVQHQGGQPEPDEIAFRRHLPGIPEDFAGMGRQSSREMTDAESSAVRPEKKREEPPAKRGAVVRESEGSHRKNGSAASVVWGEVPLKSLSGTAAGWGSSFLPVVEERESGNAQKVSRAIQLDARRYDGGFTIY